VTLSQDEDDLFESCLSTNSCSSSDNEVNDGIVRGRYFESLQLSRDDADKLQCRRDVRGVDDLRPSASSHSSNHQTLTAAVSNKSVTPTKLSRKDDVSVLTRNRADHFAADAANMSKLDSMFSSLHVSGDNSIGQSWMSSDLTSVTPLSNSSCCLHSVRIERQPVADGDDDKCCSLVETVLIPTEQTDANTSCQHDDLECFYLSDDSTLLSDWKTASEAGDDEVGVTVTVPAGVKALSAAELRTRLSEFGESPGPIVESTRRVHELRLSLLMADCDGHRTTAANDGNQAPPPTNGLRTGALNYSVFKRLTLL